MSLSLDSPAEWLRSGAAAAAAAVGGVSPSEDPETEPEAARKSEAAAAAPIPPEWSNSPPASPETTVSKSPLASASGRRKSAFGDTRASFAKQSTLHDLNTGQKMKRKKMKRVNIIPEAVKMELAFSQLAEIKRQKTVGQRWNSAAIFTVMVLIYIIAAFGYLIFDNEATACPYWQVYFGMRCLVLVPSSFLAWLWGRGSWSRRMPLPETMGFVLFTYIALIITIGFTTSINQSCGRQHKVNDSTIYIKLLSKVSSTVYQVRRGDCTVLDTDTDAELGTCDAKLVDRRTWFEVNVAEFVGQLLLTLFAYTALFKPGYQTSAWYTGVVLFLGFLGCWWQGFEFWEDSDRVIASGVGPAIFVFVCAAAVNVFNSSEMSKLERSLVNASHELSEARYIHPTGEKVVYLKAEIVGAQELTLENPMVMDRAVAAARELFLSLSKVYFGYELSLDGELKQLLSKGKALTLEQTKKVQELMKSGKREDSDFLLAFHDVYDAVSFALTFQNELMDLDWDPELSTSRTGLAATEGVQITPEEKESRARAMTVGTFVRAKDSDVLNLASFHGLRVKVGVHIGPDTDGLQGSTVRFTEALSSIAEGGMVLVSPPVAEQLAGALEQLSNKSSQDAKASSAAAYLRASTRSRSLTSSLRSSSLRSSSSSLRSSSSSGGGGGGGGGSSELPGVKSEGITAVSSGSDKASSNVPRLVHMGSLLFEGSGIYHEARREAEAEAAETAAAAAADASSSGGGKLSKRGSSSSNLKNGGGGGTGDVEMALMKGAQGADPKTLPVEVWHIFNEPLFGRHIRWDDMNLKLSNARQLAFGYYDAPVKRENRPEFAVVCFGDVDNAHELMHEDHPTFTEAIAEVNRVMNRLLVKHNGYNVPQREGHYMQTFSDPKDAVSYHVELQRELLESRNWPAAYTNNPHTRPIHDTAGSGDLLYNGLQVSLGMSVGKISKALERARANYLGPTCNRSARVCGLAKRGQLLMCQSEYDCDELALVRGLYRAKVMLTEQTLKGIKGVHDIVSIETDELTTRRAVVARPKPGDNMRQRRSQEPSAQHHAAAAGGGGAAANGGGDDGSKDGSGRTSPAPTLSASGLTMMNFGMSSSSNRTGDSVTTI